MSNRSKPTQKSTPRSESMDVEDMLFESQAATGSDPSGSAWEPAGGSWDARPDLDDLDDYLVETPGGAARTCEPVAAVPSTGHRNPLREENPATNEMSRTIARSHVPASVAESAGVAAPRGGGTRTAAAVLLLGLGACGVLFVRGADPVLCGIAAGLGVFAAVIVKLVGRG